MDFFFKWSYRYEHKVVSVELVLSIHFLVTYQQTVMLIPKLILLKRVNSMEYHTRFYYQK